MVSDPRVSTQLSRLGGVYRDPARVDRDASSLLKSSVGTHLIPIIAEMVENNGDTANVLVLQGTIAMHFRGNTYQLLVDIYLASGYPNRPPVPFVRLATPNMYLKENHRHVGMDGKVYLPYLHEWNRNTHNLVELVVAMSSVFSAEPPVFSRATPAPPQLDVASPGRASLTVSATAGAADTDQEAILLAEIAEANEAAEAARRADLEEERVRREAKAQQEAAAKQRAYDQARLLQVKQAVDTKIRKHLLVQAQEGRQYLQTDARAKQRLELAENQKIDYQMELYQSTKEALEKQLATVQEKTLAIQEWLQDHAKETKHTSTNGVGGEKNVATVDDLVQPASSLQAQMMDMAAENHAISDALYFLDKALYQGHLPTAEEHLRQVRQLAKRQFLIRAHLLKIQQYHRQQQFT